MGYETMYQHSIADPQKFWAQQAEYFITWHEKWQAIDESDFTEGKVAWFRGAKLNASFNCLDRHLAKQSDKIAIFWEGDNLHRRQAISYQRLYERVCRFANVLKAQGIQKGDRICIYLPMIPDAMIAMLACARIGAVHCVVFAGFSALALAERIKDSGCKMVITADEGIRQGKVFALKSNVDDALDKVAVKKVIVIKNSGAKVRMHRQRDAWYHDLAFNVPSECEPQIMDAEDPLFILYTSGSTGTPKGILHTTGGYLLYSAITFRYVFDYHPQDIFWCTADVGWITGHSYGVYGPLANGASIVMYEGVPTAPEPDLAWKIVDYYQVTIFYTAPTAIRSLMAFGDAPLASSKRDSLRILGSVGEPINPEAWRWYHDKIGNGRCEIVDTWWQTETGGIMIAPIPSVSRQKPGAATTPFLGIEPLILNENKEPVKAGEKGFLVIAKSWPGQARTIYGNSQRFFNGYFSRFPGHYFTGDGAYKDSDGDFWLTGRVDDVMNISGHRLGTAEIESALVLHPFVAEAAVVSVPHAIKGEGIYAFVTLIDGQKMTLALAAELKQQIAKEIGKFAIPEEIHFAPKLPKTRSGKIMRRILRCIATGELDKMGDISTLADPDVLSLLLK
ncbi:acetate--CoA ligase [Candidatus Berkiella aquae]|uniref:Acetate--CoA ligase n=1 Tax=Candidatus Berkiella aquae TaxID=295108 RepID=A0A0Q9YUR7_9GAMM|nr:acetate--CoA ligase [Candidatus Berkiella aquae]MCS5710215.1 acetate--CoA ligase [Candidatus Berkiella aquae]